MEPVKKTEEWARELYIAYERHEEKLRRIRRQEFWMKVGIVVMVVLLFVIDAMW